MQKTANYGLSKPEYNNVADVYPAVCENMDILDKEMWDISNASNLIYPTTNVGNRYYVTVPGLTSLADGYLIKVKFNAVSTGGITLNVNNLGDIPVIDYFKNQVNNVHENLIANICYESNNKNFQLLGKGGGGNAAKEQILSGATATVNSGPITGNMPNNGAITITPKAYNQSIPVGYHNGNGYVQGDSNLTPSNILYGKTIFGVTGNIQTYLSETIDWTVTTSPYTRTIQLKGYPVFIHFRGEGHRAFFFPKPYTEIIPQIADQLLVFNIDSIFNKNTGGTGASLSSDGVTYSLSAYWNETNRNLGASYDADTKKITISANDVGDSFTFDYYYIP